MIDSIPATKIQAIDPLLQKHYRYSVIGTYDLLSEYEMDFPCSRDEVIECMKQNNVKYEAGGEQISKLADNPTLIDALWVMMSRCQWESSEMQDNFEDYWKGWHEGIEDDGSDEYQEYIWSQWQEAKEQFYKTKAKKDLLQLYIYHKTKPADIPTQITIKYGKGKSVKLENKDNWFEKVLLSNHLDKYLSDIKSVEDAKKVLDKLNHTTDKLSRPHQYKFIYGTYSMISDVLGLKSVPESLCYLLINLMYEMDYPTEYMYKKELRRMDTRYIRNMISRLKKDPKRAQFNLNVPLESNDMSNRTIVTSLYTKLY